MYKESESLELKSTFGEWKEIIITFYSVKRGGYSGNGELNGELNERQLAVLNTIKALPGIQLKDLAEELKIPYSTTDKYIRLFLEKNLIERRGSKKTGGYFAI